MGIKEQLKQQLQQLALQQNALTQQLKQVEDSIRQATFTLQAFDQAEKEAQETAEAEKSEAPSE
ncbi:hypothetical protein [Microbulbifer discodermiae]|uniref:hypothetical protein n=1 Tax=Microbulbifer sp. 2201CG32-9 TaxID=3232309 RepID=UPI00345BF462